MRSAVLLAATWIALAGLSALSAYAQAAPAPTTTQTHTPDEVVGTPDNDKCAICHHAVQPFGMPRAVASFEESVHGSMDCTGCHVEIEELTLPESLPAEEAPHPVPLKPVDCGSCHAEAAEIYQMHGRARIGTDPDVPTCAGCHGAHDILPIDDQRSHAHPVNVPDTCRRCHEDLDLVKKHDILVATPIAMYRNSVHGKATQKGLWVSATCNDCHSADGPEGTKTAHRILGPADPESPIYHFNIPKTCGRCHPNPTQDYWEGIHGKLVARGEVSSPVCTHCHGEHGIIKVDDAQSPVSAAKLAEMTCSPCHDSVRLNEKYGLASGRLRSFVDSYHGLKTKAGDKNVANCASCHGAHRILPAADVTSSIHPDNLRATCGKCHPGISAEMAQVPIHATGTGIKTGWPYFFTVLYIVIIVVTIGGMLLHNIAHWWRHLKRGVRKPFVIRLNPNEVIQHWMLMLSFIVLVISGFALRFDESWWAQWLFGWDKGFLYRGIVHRVAGIVMIFGSVWHVLYVAFSQRGRHWLRDMVAGKKDFRDFYNNVLYFLGAREHSPRFGRFSYMEKAEYWALVWGGIIMSVTGLMLWFDNTLSRVLPKGVLEVILVIHYYEAWLATLAILVWHIYGTMFSPEVYPMNPAWWAGKMPKTMYDHEHPEGPRLKARAYVAHVEEEIEPELSHLAPAAPVPPSAESVPAEKL